MAVKLQADSRAFDKAMGNLIRELRLDVQKETLRQAKLLALQVATNTPPLVKGMKGLAAGIPRAKAKSWLKVVKKLVKPAYAMRVVDAVRARDIDTLWGIADTKTKPPFRDYKGSAANRILELTKRDAVKGMEIFSRMFKATISSGPTPKVYQEMDSQAFAHYYKLLDKMGKGGLKQIKDGEKIYLREPINAERQKIIAAYIPTIGAVKAGWVQAAVAIPSTAGRKPPNWLLNKKVIGGSTVMGEGMRVTVSMRNGKGNAKGMDDRVGYVAKALRQRTNKMRHNLKWALKAALAKKYRAMGQPVPAHLAGGRPNDNLDD